MSDSSWLQTFTGRKVFPLDLKPEDVCIEDIAHALANLCRFNGHVRTFYSVAEHSVLVSRYCAPADALWGLLHDASEAYLQDIPRPLKRRPEFAFYREAEARAMVAICDAFGLPHETPASVKMADERMLATEARDVMSPLHPDWRVMAVAYPASVYELDPPLAEIAFTQEFIGLATGIQHRARIA